MDKDYKLDPVQIINNLEENEINLLCKEILKKAFDDLKNTFNLEFVNINLIFKKAKGMYIF